MGRVKAMLIPLDSCLPPGSLTISLPPRMNPIISFSIPALKELAFKGQGISLFANIDPALSLWLRSLN